MRSIFKWKKIAKQTFEKMPTPHLAQTVTAQPPNENDPTNFLQGFDASYYLSHYRDVATSSIDPLKHYQTHGWRENRRPNDWFDPIDYVKRNPELKESDTNPYLHFLAHNGNVETGMTQHTPSKEDLRIVRKHFDAKFYIEQNPDVMTRTSDPLLHFMTQGWVEMRDPNPNFSVSYYLRKNEDIRLRAINPYLHYLKEGVHEKGRASATIADAKILAMFEDDAQMSGLVAKAKLLEPMLAIPDTPRRITSPLKWALPATSAVERLRTKLSGKTYRYVVTIPHVGMSGASRVAALFADALAQVRDPSEILVVTTDSSEREDFGWFSDELDIVDVSNEMNAIGPDQKVRALVDVVRGVGCQTIINVNSRLMWGAIDLYGRQLHQEFKIVTYLFTSEENINGDRFGYPIQWLRKTADHHHLFLTDTKTLANDVSDRLGLNRFPDGAQVLPLYTPTSGEKIVANRNLHRNACGHFLWAGRFDPQKRFDVLIDIAKANPEMTFDVYGKTVLGPKELEDFEPPENIIYKGTYTDLQEVLNTPYSGFLYTSQWDGLPTILLDMVMAGLPVVAPNVGGIAEVLDHTTGWLVNDFKDVDGYSSALMEMASDPEGADVRARAFKTLIEDQFAPEDYIKSIKKMVTTYGL